MAQQLPAEISSSGDAVTVIEAGPNPDADQGYERPRGPAPAWTRRITQVLRYAVLAALIAAYPTMIMLSNKISDAPLSLAGYPSDWATRESAVARTLITREIDETGWTDDLAAWRPQARLTALPAWQNGVVAALSAYMLQQAELAGADGAPDEDLMAAGRLLRASERIDMTPRLKAAVEALDRYEDRVRRDLARPVTGPAAMQERLRLLSQWSATSKAELASLVGENEGWPAGQAGIKAFYASKARAYVAAEMLAALGTSEAALLEDADLLSAQQKALDEWRDAASMRPLFVSNLAGDAMFGGNHLAALGFQIELAGDSTTAFHDLIDDRRESARIGGAADFAMLAPAPAP